MELADRLLVLAVEQEQLADSLGLVAGGVPGLGLALQRSGEDAQVRQPADERVGRGLEDAGHERAVRVHDDLDFLALGIRGDDLVQFGRGGQVVHDRVDERPHADVLGRAADQDRRHHAGPDGLVQARLELRVGDLLALEVLGHDVVVGFGSGLEQLVATQRDLVGQARRHGNLDFLAALDLVRLAVEQVHVARERLGGADGDVKRRDLLAEGGPQRVQRVGRVRVLAIALVDEEEGGPAVGAGQRDRRLEAGLDVPGGVHQQDRRVSGGEALDDLGREVRVSGGVDELDPRSLVIQAGHGEGERLLALLLLGLVVQARRAVVDAAEPRDRAGIEKEALGQRRLAGPGVGGQGRRCEGGGGRHSWLSSAHRSSGGVRSHRTGGADEGRAAARP